MLARKGENCRSLTTDKLGMQCAVSDTSVEPSQATEEMFPSARMEDWAFHMGSLGLQAHAELGQDDMIPPEEPASPGALQFCPQMLLTPR